MKKKTRYCNIFKNYFKCIFQFIRTFLIKCGNPSEKRRKINSPVSFQSCDVVDQMTPQSIVDLNEFLLLLFSKKSGVYWNLAIILGIL